MTDNFIAGSGLEGERSILIFHLGARYFALPVDGVIQVIPMLRLAPLPEAGRIVEGFANIHGEIVPVLSMHRHLGLPYAAPMLNSPIILIRANEQTLGLLVDEVDDIVQIMPGQVTSADAMMPDGLESPSALQGAAYLDGRVVFLLNPERLLRPGQARALNKAIRVLLAKAGVPEDGSQKSEAGRVTKGGSPTIGGAKRSRPRRLDLNAALAEQVARLVSDLPPDGSPAGGLPDPLPGEGD